MNKIKTREIILEALDTLTFVVLIFLIVYVFFFVC